VIERAKIQKLKTPLLASTWRSQGFIREIGDWGGSIVNLSILQDCVLRKAIIVACLSSLLLLSSKFFNVHGAFALLEDEEQRFVLIITIHHRPGQTPPSSLFLFTEASTKQNFGRFSIQKTANLSPTAPKPACPVVSAKPWIFVDRTTTDDSRCQQVLTLQTTTHSHSFQNHFPCPCTLSPTVDTIRIISSPPPSRYSASISPSTHDNLFAFATTCSWSDSR